MTIADLRRSLHRRQPHLPPASSPAVAEARARLRDMAGWDFFPRTELVGASRRVKRRHDEREDAAEAAFRVRLDTVRSIAELPDADLQWLLDQGWTPAMVDPRR